MTKGQGALLRGLVRAGLVIVVTAAVAVAAGVVVILLVAR